LNSAINNPIDKLLADLDLMGIRVRVKGLDLKVKWPIEVVPGIREVLVARKLEIIEALTDDDRSDLISRLTPTEREAYNGWVDIMTSDRFNMSPKAAHREAWGLLQESNQRLRLKQAMADFERDGVTRIYSTKLGRDIWICRDDAVRVSDVRIPVFTLADLRSRDGLRLDEALLLAEAKILFSGGVQNEEKQ